jgi:hypothetical protein
LGGWPLGFDEAGAMPMKGEPEQHTYGGIHWERDQLLRDMVADYDRRMSTRWGRFLMWLLRKTT